MSNEQAGVAVSANKKQNTGLVPNLRFPEFRDAGEWGEKKLGEVATFFKGRGLPKSVITPTGKNPCIHYGELFTEHQEVIQTVKNRTDLNENIFLSVENDVLMPTSDVTPNGLAKACCIKLNDVILGGDILIIRTDQQEIDGEFLARYIRHLEQKVLQLVSGSTVFHLYATSIDKLSLSFPLKQEQQKIADCLTSLDDLIRLEAGKLDALKAHKKGLMQQLFPAEGETLPKLRFPEFREAGEWEEMTIGEVGSFYYGKSAPKWSLEEDAPTRCVRYGELYTKFGAVITETYSRTNIDPSSLRFSKGGEILVPRVGEKPEDFGKCCSYLPLKDIAIGEMISVFETKQNPLFYTYYFRNLYRQFAKVVEGQNVKNLYYVELEPLPICRPSLPEQKKIADLLISLDDVIADQFRKLDVLKAHKKGLMQRLFPTLNEARV